MQKIGLTCFRSSLTLTVNHWTVGVTSTSFLVTVPAKVIHSVLLLSGKRKVCSVEICSTESHFWTSKRLLKIRSSSKCALKSCHLSISLLHWIMVTNLNFMVAYLLSFVCLNYWSYLRLLNILCDKWVLRLRILRFERDFWPDSVCFYSWSLKVNTRLSDQSRKNTC